MVSGDPTVYADDLAVKGVPGLRERYYNAQRRSWRYQHGERQTPVQGQCQKSPAFRFRPS